MTTAQLLIDELRARQQTISFCESLTAGLTCATVANVPGASDVLVGGLVTYSAQLKTSLAGVPAELIEREGVVSAAVAREMARGTRRRCNSDWAVSLTGVAGPDAQDGVPAGTVWIGLAGPRWTASSQAADLLDPANGQYALVPGAATPVRVLAGGRNDVRRLAAEAALLGALSGVREQT